MMTNQKLPKTSNIIPKTIWENPPVDISKLIEWREVMTSHGNHERAEEIQNLINFIKD